MAQKKAGGSTRNGRDSNSKSLGLKIFNNNYVYKGSTIVKQNGSKYIAGVNTFYSKNYCIQSLINGYLLIKKKKKKTIINILNVYK